MNTIIHILAVVGLFYMADLFGTTWNNSTLSFMCIMLALLFIILGLQAVNDDAEDIIGRKIITFGSRRRKGIPG